VTGILRMARAQHHAAFQHHRRLRTLALKLGNRDVDLGGFDNNSTSPKCTVWPGSSHASLTRSPLTNVPLVESQSRSITPVARQLQFAVVGRHGGMINGEITVRVAPDAIDAETQFKRPVFQTLF
jgi:hypothetical protein